MSDNGGIDVIEFRREFGGGIRVLLDWSSLLSGRCRVAEADAGSREALGDLMTVWYLSAGRPAEFHDPGAAPVSVRAATSALARWPSRRADDIRGLCARMGAAGGPVAMTLPAIRTPAGGTLLLDGTHRACAAYLGGFEVRVRLYTLDGVPDRVLPDLAHHRPAARS